MPSSKMGKQPLFTIFEGKDVRIYATICHEQEERANEGKY